MDGLRLILALHNHQPVGNFDGVFEAAYRDSYQPFLDVLENYPEIPFVLHTSGPLMEWLDQHRPEYLDRLRDLIAAGRVEILGGPFYEPILTMIPQRDRVGQIRLYSDFLRDRLGVAVRGMWMPERVWEQNLVSAIAEAGIEYTILDDFHFQRAGVAPEHLFGYYLTEEDGQLLKVFPGSETLRYLIPFQEPHASYEALRAIADAHPQGATVVFADDGEKFGTWPETYHHVYTQGWLRRFCDMIMGNRQWLEPTTFARAVDTTLPQGKVYLPDSSYREMTEWALPPDVLARYEQTLKSTAHEPVAQQLRPFIRMGGSWRNFKAKYAETDEMYTRMLGVSRRLHRISTEGSLHEGALALARRELYRAQCNCPYWHGAFGGLYLPHLRNAIFRHLIAADSALDTAEGRNGPRVYLETGDFNLDARQEIRLENDRLIALLRPAQGGHLYELDVRHASVNVLATLNRRPEAYHGTIAAHANGESHTSNHRLVFKQEGLDRLLTYDRYPRKALVDHILPLDATLDDLACAREIDRGDFLQGAYLAKVQRTPDQARLILERPGRADGHLIHVRKSIRLAAGRPSLSIHYELEDLPPGVPIHFGIEMNLAGMAGHAHDRYYASDRNERLGMLDGRLDLTDQSGLTLTDEWLDLSVDLKWSVPAGVWCFPVETVSQSEGGFESVYQSSCVLPHWVVIANAEGRWEVRIDWTCDHAHPAPEPESRSEIEASRRPEPLGIDA